METTSPSSEGVSMPSVVSQCLLMCAVFYFWSSPAIQPVKIMVVLVHEMSHGFMALASGGKVLRIVIEADEGGYCETMGGMGPLIVSAGYLGSMFFGGLLLYLSRFRGAVAVVYTFLTLTLIAAIFTVLESGFARTFATALAGSFIFLGLLAPTVLGAVFLRILGTVSCLYSIFDIYWDVLATDRMGYAVENDAVAFSRLTGVDAQLVGGLWFLGSLVYFLFILKLIVKPGSTRTAVKEKTAPASA